MRLIFLMLLLSFSSYAQMMTAPANTAQACPPCPTVTCPVCVEEKIDTSYYRDDSFGQFMFGYQYVDSWVVGKTTGSYTQIISRGWSLEFEYATSTRDMKIVDREIGEINEDRYTLLAKFYIGNSFFFAFGPFMRRINIKTEGLLRDRFGDKFNDELELETYGAALGFGNRWQTRWGITYGVDWLRINVPLRDGKVRKRLAELDEDSREKVDRVFNIVQRLPSFTLVGVNVGYTF